MKLLSILFPPKLPVFEFNDLVETKHYHYRMNRGVHAFHVKGGPASCIGIGTVREKRIIALPGRIA